MIRQNREPDTSRLQPIAGAPRGGSPLLAEAMALQDTKEFAAAEELYRRYLRTHPNDLVALNNAALVAKALGRHDVALLRLTKALRAHPQSAEAHFNRGNTLQELRRLDEAVTSYRQAIALRPDYAKAYLNLGNALDKLRRFAEAAAGYRHALARGGEDGETHSNLAHCLKQQGRLHEALVHFVCATRLEPERADFQYGVGIAYFELRDNAQAIVAFRRVLELDPTHEGARSALLFQAQIACDWTESAALAPLVRAATDRALAAGERCAEGAFETITRDADPKRNHAVAMSSAAALGALAPLWRPRPEWRTAPDGHEKIRLGYLSVDFREHPVAQVIGGVFGRHDRARFTVTAYSYGSDDGSLYRRRIAADCDRFVDLYQVADDDSARRIRDDGVDILIDLTSWTHGNRPRICALRPAPLQVQYLGFPGTSGTAFFDYAIVDRTVVQPEDIAFWSERPVFMPHTYFITDRDQKVAANGFRRAEFGLPPDGVVFCSFNQNYKIEPTAFGAWMRILAQVPGSVLWLSRTNASAEANMLREAAQRGIAPERLVFAEKMASKADHLERLALADLALDTLTYNGHTTTSDALWAGVPVVAAMGGHFASRVSAGLLKAVALDALAARDVESYVEIAVRLAHDSEERARLRAHLAAARDTAPLFDTARSVADLERAYEQMWAQFRAGAPPAMIYL